jgi:hypothetical protein
VYRIIKKNHNYITLQKFEELKSLIIEKTNYSENTLRKVLSYLNDNYIKFTKFQAVMNEQFSDEFNYCNYLLKKGNYRLLNSRIDELDKQMLDTINHDHDYFIKMYKKDVLKFDVICSSEDKLNLKSKMIKQKQYTLESSKNLMVYTIAKTTINLVNYVIQCTSIEEYNNGFFPIEIKDLFGFMETYKFKMFNSQQRNTVVLFYKLYTLFSKPLIDAHYLEYKNFYNGIKHKYNPDFRKTHHNILMNYCIFRQRVLDKDKIFTNEAVTNLYEYTNNKYYVNDKTEYLHATNYRNFVINCVSAGNKNILLKFIRKHSNKLHPNETEIMKIYGMAQYYYLNGEYALSIINAELLIKAKSHYKYDIINLLIKANYELNNFEKIRELLHNYKAYADNDILLTKTDKEWYFKFVEYTHKFLNEKEKYLKKDKTFKIEHLLHKIETETDFSTKKWLTEKLKTFISAHKKKQTRK